MTLKPVINGEETIFYQSFIQLYKNNYISVKLSSWQGKEPRVKIAPCFMGDGGNYYFKAKGEWLAPPLINENELRNLIKAIVDVAETFEEIGNNEHAQAAQQHGGGDDMPF